MLDQLVESKSQSSEDTSRSEFSAHYVRDHCRRCIVERVDSTAFLPKTSAWAAMTFHLTTLVAPPVIEEEPEPEPEKAA